MANFQFGQDNVGSNWQVPSWYVQGMSQSPMAASIAGIGNSIAAFTSGYQAAKQAERNYGTEQKKLTIQEEEVKARKDYYDYLKGNATTQANQKSFSFSPALDAIRREFRESQMADSNQPQGAIGADVLRDVNMVPATEPTLPQEQNQYSVDPYSLMSGVRQNYPTQFLQGYDPRISF